MITPTPVACILLVDDNEMDVELTIDAFESVGVRHEIHVAVNGEQALDYLYGVGLHADRTLFPLPDFVLLDLKMPKVDGFEVLRRIKNTPLVRRIPIIVLTSSREESDLASAYDTGANSYVRKPSSMKELLQLVRELDHYWAVRNENSPISTPGSDLRS